MFYVTKVDKRNSKVWVVDTYDWVAEAYSTEDILSLSKSVKIHGVSSNTVEEVNWDDLFDAANARAKLMGYAELDFCIKSLKYEMGYYLWNNIYVVKVTGIKDGSVNRTRVKIPDFVYEIDNLAFIKKQNLRGVSVEHLDLGKSLRVISEEAFAGNTELREIKNLGRPIDFRFKCFYKCGLESISVVPGMKLRSECFSHSKLKEIKLLEGLHVADIECDVFAGSDAEHLYLPSSIIDEGNNEGYLIQ